MKKIVPILSFVIAMLICTKTVHADVIWEPQNSFYTKHSKECEVLEREYIANGPDGKVTVYLDPETALEVGSFENGQGTWITWSYTDEDGVVWGCPNEMEKGWVPMDYMQVVYDHISFEEEHGDKIKEELGALDESYKGKSVYLWKYPGSETFDQIEIPSEAETWMPEYLKTYVDEEGRTWGYGGYFYGIRNFWICLDEADKDYEGLFGNAPTGDIKVEVEEPLTDENVEPIVPKGDMGLWVIGIGVVAVVLVSGIVIWKMKKN